MCGTIILGLIADEMIKDYFKRFRIFFWSLFFHSKVFYISKQLPFCTKFQNNAILMLQVLQGQLTKT